MILPDSLEVINRISMAVSEYPWAIPKLKDSYSNGQIQSKLWLVKELKRTADEIGLDLDTCLAYLLGGWVGGIATIFFLEYPESKLSFRSFDVDEKATILAEDINKKYVLDNWRFKATTLDIFDMDYKLLEYRTLRADGSYANLIEVPDLIINTSCEHIDSKKWWGLIPSGKLCVLQSNNYYENIQHINCSPSLEAFVKSHPSSEIFFQGTLELDSYHRYMLICRK